jgi:hypothetical protein
MPNDRKTKIAEKKIKTRKRWQLTRATKDKDTSWQKD